MCINPKRHSRRGGYSLLECIAYLGLFAVFMTLAYECFYRCFDQSRLLRRNADDIVRALQAGERWRQDIRPATNIVVSGTSLQIMRPEGSVTWFMTNNAIWRSAGDQGKDRWLSGVKASTMKPEERSQVSAWRWELELQSRQKSARVRPLFTFEAAPAKKSRL